MGLPIVTLADVWLFLAVTRRQRERHWCSRLESCISGRRNFKLEDVMTLLVIWSGEVASSSFLVPGIF